MIWLILLFGLILRIITLNQSFWLDEADNVVAAIRLDIISFITKYPIGDFHPPGYFFLLWIWLHLFGSSEIISRLLSVILGVGTVYLTYLLGKRLFDSKTALLAALLLSLSPLHVYYSQETRMYSLSAFSVTLSFLYLWKILNDENRAWLGYGFSLVLVLYSDYVTYLVIPVQLFICFLLKTANWRRLRRSFLMALLLYFPWLFYLPLQIKTGAEAAIDLPGWKKVAGGADLKNLLLVVTKTIFGRISFENKLFYGGFSALVSLIYGLIIFSGIKKLSKEKILLISWLILPILLVFGISFYVPMLSYFRMIYILPAFYLLLAYGLSSLPRNFLRIFASIFIIGVSLISLFIYYWNPQFQREDWRGAVKFLETKPLDKTVILFEDNNVKFPYLYYAKDTSLSFAGLKKVEAKNDDDVADLAHLLTSKNEAYVFEYLVEITDPKRLLEKKLTSLGFSKKETFNFSGVGFIYHYTK